MTWLGDGCDMGHRTFFIGTSRSGITVAVPALATSMPANKLTPKYVQELYPEQDPADVEKLTATSKGLKKVCNAVWEGALCHFQF